MKRAIILFLSLGLAFSLLPGCPKFPEDDREPQQISVDGVYVTASEFLAKKRFSNQTMPVAAEITTALEKMTNHGQPIVSADSKSGAAVVIEITVSTYLHQQVDSPGLNQGRYGAALSVKYISNYSDETILNETVTKKNFTASTGSEAAIKAAKWAAAYFIRYYLNDNERQDLLLKNLPISKFPKKKQSTESEEPTVEPES